MSKLKVLVTYHKPSVLFQDEVLIPIHLGRALVGIENKDGVIDNEEFSWLCENMIGDDTGENISHLNHYFNEMTGVYWAWKNYDVLGNPEYIGFMSYRCLFSMKKDTGKFSPVSKNQRSYCNFQNFSEYIWSDEDTKSLLGVLKNNDFITNLPIFLKTSIKEQYDDRKSLSEGHIKGDLEHLKDIIETKFPQYQQEFLEYIKSNESYFTNMFIMKKELFFKYCEFIFPILFEYHNATNYSNRNVCQQRMFVSERLTGMFYKHIQKSGYIYTQLPVNVIHNTSLNKIVKPAFKQEDIALIFSVDESFIPYLYVALNSLIKHSQFKNYYDICILHISIPKNIQTKILSLSLEKANISIRFIDVSAFIGKERRENPEVFYLSNHIKLPTYYRFFIPDLFREYKKVIYLDVDMVILEDIAKLYEVDIANNILAACRDVGINYELKSGNEHFKKYLKEKLQLKNPYSYIQAGLLIYNIKECLAKDFTKLCLQKLKELHTPLLHDQDVLNAVFEGKIYFLPLQYNYTWNTAIKFPHYAKCLDVEMAREYTQAGLKPSIIHYCDNFKPWSHPYLEKADIWWSYARNTPFYEQIIKQSVSMLYGAEARIKNQLSYKIGAMILNSKTFFKALRLPFSLVYLILQFKKDLFIYQSLTRINPQLKQPRLESYADYPMALKAKKHLSYKLGSLLLKHPFSFVFRVGFVYRDFKNKRQS